jgi:SPP1 gp7 family putative phage head morphogenesis protein
MVDVKVFTDMYGKIDKKTEAKIKKFLGNAKNITQLQAKTLQSIINDALRSIGKITTIEEAAIFASVNVFQTSKATEKLIPYQDNMGKMFRFGVKFTSKEPSATVLQLEESVKQSTARYITKLGEDLKTRAGEIVSDGVKFNIPSNDIVANLEKELNISRARANSIARTETMRAAHAGSYAQAIREGKSFFIVDSRAEACILCKKKYMGQIFDITESREMPPLHPNCACIPLYFNDFDDAARWATKIGYDIEKQVAMLEQKGKIIKKDGTGAEVSKIPAKKRLKN